MRENICAVILAAGDGKRMHSRRPKALCQVLMEPMIGWVTRFCRRAGVEEICIVTGEGGQLIQEAVGPGVHYACQRERRGTGHALRMAEQFLRGSSAGTVLVLNGDAPFVSDRVIAHLAQTHRQEENAVTVLSAHLEQPRGYGRILREADGALAAIVEEADADEAVRLIQEVNSGAYCIEKSFLLEAFSRFDCRNAQGEYYLTQVVEIARSMGLRAGACLEEDPLAAMGANDRRQLAQLNELARRRVLERLYEAGVDIPCTDGVMVSPTAQVGRDACILPGSVIKGDCVIGEGAVIGPNTWLENSRVGADSTVNSCQVYEAEIGAGCTIGPFTYLRPGTRIGNQVKIGDFVEVKNSTVGDHTSVAHLTYVGDADVGRGCNFGCGVVLVNYDGEKKYRSTIGDDAFIGCNANLISPVTVGDGAYVAAGTTLTQDVPEGALAIGRAPQQNKPGWMEKTGKFKGRR